ncbi:DUF262 domain-containing HNH endonuclease family protein [uncultured Pseudoalteromonas sp.]|uniref:DUF262 domain-containing protein n=1 Tax=uncultured Pseudoalteromonas sp. TaxID=114053 RepID=UPI00259611C0|nr:DUF262 domain-containing HNH endonuclease family protein [uncultured Pseudoalteromonas sp.]
MANVFSGEANNKGNQITQHHVETQVLTLNYIQTNQYQFSIPSYQRPYVWPDEAVLKLFNDINDARLAEEPIYFIGTVLTSVELDEGGNGIYELIDGQQRTTTLMLIALAFKIAKVDSAIADIAAFKRQPRLQFTIRDQVQHLLGSLAGLDDYVFPGLEAIGENPYLKRIYAALQVLEQQVKALKNEERILLGDYIFENVQWVNNIVPSQMDLNRLFATMNTTGIQLEQADILKSKLLKQVSKDKALFDAMWLACEHMENYFERNVRKVFPNAPWDRIESEHLACFKEELFVKDESASKRAKQSLTIMQLAEQLNSTTVSGSEGNQDNKSNIELGDVAYDLDTETVYCRPIIGFPLLLIHAYRIYLANRAVELGDGTNDVAPRVHADKLLETFEPLITASENEVKEFIKTLWQVRYQFDRWVVKWVERDDSDDEQLRLTNISQSDSNGKRYINRTQKEINELVMLQSVRNFTGERSAQYWITPFIAGLIKDNITQDAQAIALLEKIDNDLSLAAKSETQKTASFKLAKQHQPEVYSWLAYENYFAKPRGTSFEHYWFQKLEYILWKQESDRQRQQFKNYRITAKNSVEHVYPQHEEYQNMLERDFLDAFGNLVLLSPGENSSYSNQAVKKKLVDFEAKLQYDSLKLKAMFKILNEQKDWQEAQIKEHQKDMLSALAKHYDAISNML